MSITLGTGDHKNVIHIVQRFLEPILVPQVPTQLTIMNLIKKYKTLDDAVASFKSDFIRKHLEYEDKDGAVYTMEYQDGFQDFLKESRDYRGTTILVNKTADQSNYQPKYILLRGALPVMPDTIMIERDPQIMQYLSPTAWKRYASHKLDWKTYITFHPSEMRVTRKYDGSMANITVIPKNTIQYYLFKKLADKWRKNKEYKAAFIDTDSALIIIGSKGRFAARVPVQARILHTIETSYDSITNFTEILTNFMQKNNFTNQCVTLHMEAIIDVPTPELTVYYNRTWLPFYGFTVFSTDGQSKFNLPDPIVFNLERFQYVAPIYDFKSWTEYFQFRDMNYQKLLDGDQEIEPEGYVIHIYDTATGEWFPLKDKYPFYYLAHKPNSERYKEEAKEFEINPKYDALRARLAKFRTKLPIRALCEDLVEAWVKTIPNPTNPEPNLSTKKHWAMYWKTQVEALNEASNAITEAVIPHYPTLKNKIHLFPFIMKCYDLRDIITADVIINHFESLC
jgi:hypothetical protein